MEDYSAIKSKSSIGNGDKIYGPQGILYHEISQRVANITGFAAEVHEETIQMITLINKNKLLNDRAKIVSY